MLTSATEAPATEAPARAEATARVATPAGRDAGPSWTFARRAMGSPLRLTVTGGAGDRAAAAWQAVSEAVESIEEELSRFRATSGLVALDRRAGDPGGVPVGRWLAAALAAADRAQRLTGGAFDPRILGDLERLGYPGASLEPGTARPAGGVGHRPVTGAAGGRGATFPDGRWLHLDPRAGRAAVAAPIDLGGIGKGLALRWAMRALERALPEIGRERRQREVDGGRPQPEPGDLPSGALLEAGGDIVARGTAPGGGPWMIAIEDPDGAQDPAVVAVRDGAICTSSVAVHRWRDDAGRTVHHLLDPRSGEPGGEGLLAVTVAGPDPAWAEVRSKTLFLEGRRAIAQRARALGLAAWWIRDDGVLEMTPAARLATAWTLA